MLKQRVFIVESRPVVRNKSGGIGSGEDCEFSKNNRGDYPLTSKEVKGLYSLSSPLPATDGYWTELYRTNSYHDALNYMEKPSKKYGSGNVRILELIETSSIITPYM